jgi:GNAT superfamily N-acetyltransferase
MVGSGPAGSAPWTVRHAPYDPGMSSSVRLTSMSADQFRAYRDIAEQSYASNIVMSGMMPGPEARQKAASDFETLLPDGVDTAHHEFWTALDADEEVGMLWLAFTEKSDGLHAFGYDFLVTSGRRRQGYGRAIMAAAEDVCRARGVVEVGLSVFGFNTGAQALYEQMGFEVTTVQMRKRM